MIRGNMFIQHGAQKKAVSFTLGKLDFYVEIPTVWKELKKGVWFEKWKDSCSCTNFSIKGITGCFAMT